jgi:integrase
LERFRNEHGDRRIAMLQRVHIDRMLAQKVDAPVAAQTFLKTLRGLMRFAVANGLRSDDPTQGVKPPKPRRNSGYHTWSEDEIARFEAHHAISTRARLAFALLLYTAQRRGDVVRMGRQHVREGMLCVTQQKTGTPLEIPVHPALAAVIEATPSPHLTFLVTGHGRPFTAAGFGNWFRNMCDEAGLPPECASHGLRKAACRRLAEAGCSANVIASISGHKTLREVGRYTKAADQARMAKAGMAAVLQHGTEIATSGVKPDEKV